MEKRYLVVGAVLVLVGIAALIGSRWTSGPTVDFEKTWSFRSGELSDLKIKSEYPANVTFKKSTDGTNSVYVKGDGPENVKNAVEAAVLNGGELNLDLRDRRAGFGSWFHWGFGFGSKDEEIVVTLTDEAQLKHLGLQGDSGSLTVRGARADAIEITADSGSLSIEDLTADRLTLKADSGSIKGSRIRADSDIRADSGSIKLEGFTGPARIRADSGSVKLYKEDTADTDIKADSGSITAPEFKRETKDLIKVRTDSGSIKIEQ